MKKIIEDRRPIQDLAEIVGCYVHFHKKCKGMRRYMRRAGSSSYEWPCECKYGIVVSADPDPAKKGGMFAVNFVRRELSNPAAATWMAKYARQFGVDDSSDRPPTP